MNRAWPTCTRMGTLRWLKLGMPSNSASVRTKGHSSGFSHASSCASVKLIIASADDLRDGLQRALDVLDQGRHHPGPGDGQHGHGRDHLGHEAQGRFIDLRGGLEHADQHADQQHGQQDGGGHQHQHVETLLAEGENLLCVHGSSTQVTKEAAREPSSRFHPSASTNSISLKGRATSTGDSIIIPRLISTLLTIMSMTRKGMKIRKAIWKALFSSLVTKAGTSTLKGTASGFTEASSLARRENSATSAWRVCLSMKPRIGTSARCSATSKPIWPLPYGCQASA